MIEFFALNYRAEFLIPVTLRESGHLWTVPPAAGTPTTTYWPKLSACAYDDPRGCRRLIVTSLSYRWLDDATLPPLKDRCGYLPDRLPRLETRPTRSSAVASSGVLRQRNQESLKVTDYRVLPGTTGLL